jgi:hypothetical protein
VSRAADGSQRDLTDWRGVLALTEGHLAAAHEEDVTGFDPIEDLDRRGRWWGHRFDVGGLLEVVSFGVALAMAETDAWQGDDPVVATRAFEDRRFLFSDRLVHWVVPLTFVTPDTGQLRDLLLAMGDRLRPAPVLTGTEGLYPPGEDSFGPMSSRLRVDLGPPERWRSLAAAHPGTAALWLDLEARVLSLGGTAR